jgi:dTDP-4-amino-4,6-dideoxygalactose transaminase
MKVPLFDMQRENAALRSELHAAAARVIDSGIYVGGGEVTAFEAELAKWSQCTNAIGVSSGTDALLSVAMALQIGPGHNVVTTPFSYIATAAAFARVGARIVFADIDPDSCNLDPRLAAAACDDKTAAIVTVNLYGRLAGIDLPQSIPVIEDAAQSIGAAGVRGIAATTSFFPTKNLGAIGDAGAVLTDDAALAHRLRQIRAHGAAPKYHYPLLGGNFRLDALQAALLRVKLPHLHAATAARRRNAQRYADMFAAASLSSAIRTPHISKEHVVHQYVIRCDRRDQLQRHLTECGIGTEIYYPEPLHLQPCFAHLGYKRGDFPHAELAAAQVMALPIAPTVTEAEQSYVAESIARFFLQTG